MASPRWNSPDLFCYICGKFTLKHNRVNINDFVKKAYRSYFGFRLMHQNKHWAPHVACKNCIKTLWYWTQGKRHMRFSIPVIWCIPRNHHDDCYFCVIKLTGVNCKNKHTIAYPDILSVRKPVPHSDILPVPTFSSLSEIDDGYSDSDSDADADDMDVDSDYEKQLKWIVVKLIGILINVS